MRLVLNALVILRGLVEKHGRMVLSYDIKFARERTIPDPKTIRDPERWKSSDAIQEFCRFSQRFFTLLPKSLDSAAPIEIIRAAKASSPTGYFFSHVAPDYSSGFQLLGQVDSFLFLPQPLVYIPNNWMWQGKYSVGQSSYKKEALTERWLRELPVKVEDIQALAPVKCKWLWINNVLYDFHTKYQRPGMPLQLDWVRYHGFCAIIVLMGKRLGADMSMEITEIRKSLGREGVWFTLKVLWNIGQRLAQLGFHMIRSFVRPS